MIGPGPYVKEKRGVILAFIWRMYNPMIIISRGTELWPPHLSRWLLVSDLPCMEEVAFWKGEGEKRGRMLITSWESACKTPLRSPRPPHPTSWNCSPTPAGLPDLIEFLSPKRERQSDRCKSVRVCWRVSRSATNGTYFRVDMRMLGLDVGKRRDGAVLETRCFGTTESVQDAASPMENARLSQRGKKVTSGTHLALLPIQSATTRADL